MLSKRIQTNMNGSIFILIFRVDFIVNIIEMSVEIPLI